jgi:uracil-DNA glycosylase family 4
MAKEVDLDKVVRQHLEVEDFFTGFVMAGKHGSVPIQSKVARTGMESRTEPRTSSDPPRMSQRHGPTETEVAKARAALEKIAAEVSQCCKCGLGSSRTHAVPGEGSPKARIMFVGEAPGADEDAQGRPFVGRAGQLLDKIIAACHLKREDVFIANILKCRPPDNRDPRPEEIISCLPYLQRQIEIIEPEIIVALGAHAARTLLDTNKSIGQLRGQFHEYYSGIGRLPIRLMATFHPAYLLRNYSPENRRKVWEDMKRVLAELGLPVSD